MTTIAKSALGLAACAALFASHTASAKDCVTPEQLSDVAIYMMPSAIDAAQQKCGAMLGKDSYLMTSGDNLGARYAALSDEAWPGAFEAIKVIASSSGQGGAAAFLGLLAPSEVRGMVGEFAKDAIAKKIKPKDCGNINQGLTMIADIPPKKLGGLTGFLLSITGGKKVPVCSSSAASAKR